MQQWDALIVSIFSSWILSIPYEQHLIVVIDIRPLNSANFILTHSGRYRKTDDAA
jgi:hypothetical protein